MAVTDTTTIPTWPKLSLPHGLLPGTLLAANVFVRSAMFSTLDYAGSARRPDVLESLKISAIAPYDVEQVGGSRLSQSDADLLFWLLARAYRGGPPRGPARVYFRRAEALAALQRKRGGKTDALLDVSLIRLSRAEFVAKFHAVNSKFRLLACVERVEREDCGHRVRYDAIDRSVPSNGFSVDPHHAVRRRHQREALFVRAQRDEIKRGNDSGA